MEKQQPTPEKKKAAPAPATESVNFGEGLTRLLPMIRDVSESAKEVFLWEVLRNASHALAILRLESLVHTDVHGAELGELFILIVPDYDKGTLTVIDNGTGMGKDELHKYLCDIPERALNKYLENIRAYSHADDHDLSARLTKGGVDDVRLGFHSAYMVADKVMVTTKKSWGSQFVWTGDLKSKSCTIAQDNTSGEGVLDRRGAGTAVTLFLNKEHRSYADKSHLIDLTKKYVERLMYPVYISSVTNDSPKEEIFNGPQKEKLLELRELMPKFVDLRACFEKFIGFRVENVVLDDCVHELANHLSSDKKTFVINPRSPITEEMSLRLEVEDEEMKDMVNIHFRSCMSNIRAYDLLHGTNYYYHSDLDKAMQRPGTSSAAFDLKLREALVDECVKRQVAKRRSMDMKT